MNIILAIIVGSFVLAGLIGIARALTQKEPDPKPTADEEWEVRQW